MVKVLVSLVCEDLYSVPSSKKVNLINWTNFKYGEKPGLGFGPGVSSLCSCSRVLREGLGHWLVFSALPGWGTLNVVGRGEGGSPVSYIAKHSPP